MDDLFADLANIAIFHCSTPDEEMLLLQNYFGRMPSEQECARLALMKLPAKMFYGLEFLSLSGPSLLAPPQTFACYQNFGKHGQVTEKADFLAYSLTLLNEVREFASCNEYKQALHHCK